MLARVGELEMTVRDVCVGPKGKAPLRQCPPDFDVIFIEKGRDMLPDWYRASKRTVNRWLEERGKERLIAERARFVASQRAAGNWLTRQTCMVEVRRNPAKGRTHVTIRDRRKVLPLVAKAAAHFLRISRNGGWVVLPAPNGDWFLGSKRLSAAQLVDYAKGKGFDPAPAIAEELAADPAARLGDFATRNELILRREMIKTGHKPIGGPVRPYNAKAAKE